MSREDMINELWIKYDYHMMGYQKDDLFKNMPDEELKKRLEWEVTDG